MSYVTISKLRLYETINFNITEVSHPIHVLFPIIYFEDNPTSVNAVNMSHIYHTTNFRFRCRRHHKLLYFVSDLNHSITLPRLLHLNLLFQIHPQVSDSPATFMNGTIKIKMLTTTDTSSIDKNIIGKKLLTYTSLDLCGIYLLNVSSTFSVTTK